MKLSSMKVNAARAEQGAWVKDLPGMGDLRLRGRGFSNTDYTAFLAKEGAAIPRDQRVGNRSDGALKPEARDTLFIRGMAEHILVDWENLTDENDKPIPYSKERAMGMLLDPDLRPFREAVAFAGAEVEQVESDRVEAVVGNSSPASGGRSSGRRGRNTSVA